MTRIYDLSLAHDRREFVHNPQGLDLADGDWVMVGMGRPDEIGRITGSAVLDTDSSSSLARLRSILRRAASADLALRDKTRDMERHAMKIGKDQIAFRELPMKLVDVHQDADSGRLTFFFTAEHRVDFRELVKDLAAVFRTRIELRQIGTRDAARRMPVLGVCGSQTCCSRFISSFEPITLKMAKDQHLPLSPAKLGGTCGRLKCCLTHELDFYRQMRASLPRLGGWVQTPQGPGRVTKLRIFRQEVVLELESGDPLTIPLARFAQMNPLPKSPRGQE